MFDPITYFETLTDKLKTTKDNNYHFAKVSGLESLEEIFSNRKKYKNFIAVDDSENGTISRGNGGGYFKRRPYTVFICTAVRGGDMAKRDEALTEHKEIFHAFLTKIIQDRAASSSSLQEWDPSRVPFYEMPGQFAGGCVGLYFMIYIDNPDDLRLNANDWYD